FADESDDTPISYTSVENKYYRYKKDGTALSESDADNPNFQLSKTEGGYLAFMDRNYLYFISDDAKSFYVYEGDISAFVGPNDTKDFSDNEFAQSAAAQIKDMAYLTLPAPETDNLEIWHGWNLDSDGERSFYEAFLAGIEPSDYAEHLKKNGFTVSRAGDDLKFNLFYGERGGYWMAIDPSGDLAVILRSIDYLYAAPNGKTYGPERNTDIWFKKAKQGYYSGRLLTADTDWSDRDKETMMSWYDGSLGVVIPFFPMEDNYSVSKGLTSASEDLFGGALMLDHKCYKIYDNSLIYRLEGYGKVLEENGYRLYEPEYDISTDEGWDKFKNSDESKYYECYINKEKNVAVKYSFSIYDGNVIKVFKLDEMKSHLDDPR
nr:hypothetical protein [Bacilli bacterium]